MTMFWADKITQEIKKRKLPLEWVDDMKTPSGRIHVGALRGVVIHDLAYNALKEAGVKTKSYFEFKASVTIAAPSSPIVLEFKSNDVSVVFFAKRAAPCGPIPGPLYSYG